MCLFLWKVGKGKGEVRGVKNKKKRNPANKRKKENPKATKDKSKLRTLFIRSFVCVKGAK